MASQTQWNEFEQAPEDGEGQESLELYSPWGCRESDVTEQLNNKNTHILKIILYTLSGCTTWLARSELPNQILNL